MFGAIGKGLEGFGDTLGAVAQFQDRINEENDDTQARLLSAEAAAAYSTATNEYQALQAGAAREAQGTFTERLNGIRDTVLSRAGNPRQRQFLEQRLTGLHSASASQIAGHAVKEQKVERNAAFGSQISSYAEMAATTTDPLVRDQAIASAVAVRRDQLMSIDGMDPEAVPELFAMEEMKIATQVHSSVLDRMFAVPDPDIDEITGYLDAYGDEMTSALRNQTLGRLQDPLQGRIARDDANVVMGLAIPETAEAVNVATGVPPTAVGMVREFEGFRQSTYWDVNHHRVGYGSDTITTASGQVRTVKAGDRVSPEDAERDLQRRLGELDQTASQRAGQGWRQLPESARAAVLSVAYNYGAGSDRLNPLWEAAAKGDPGAVANVIESFARDNNGVNRSRRMQEAEAARSGGAYTNTPREWDRTQVYANLEAAAEREGWNPERVERVKAEIDRRIQRDEGMLQEVRQDADEAVTEIVQAKGAGFTSTNMVPRDVWNRLSPADKIQWEAVAEANSKPAVPPANGPAAMTLNQMRYYDPDAFKTENLAKYMGQMTPAELDTLLQQQARMRTERPDDWNPRSGLVTALNYGKKINAMDLEPEQEAAVLQIMEAEAERLYRQNGNKPLTEDEYQTLFRSATRNVTTTVRLPIIGTEVSQRQRARYDLTLDMMPASTRTRLTERARRTLGREPTDEQLLRLYRLEQ